jgi:alanine racemase
MFDSSLIEISSSAYQNNLKFIRRKIKKGVRLCSVVKGNAYGHGLSPFVKLAIESGVDYFGVHSVEEAYFLKSKLTEIPDLFIMGKVDGEALEWTIKESIEFSVFDFERLNTAIEYAKKLNIKAKIHVEIETGMNRTGFAKEQLIELSALIKKNIKYLELYGLFTHYAGAESRANDFRISEQIKNFNEGVRFFKSKKLQVKYIHSACSAAMLNYPETHGNMVRIGILQYGFWPNKETHIRYNSDKEKSPELLKRVIRWTCQVMAIKEVKKGEFIGYGTAYLSHKKMKLAVIPIGYSHGYSRKLSNVGSVLINGKTCMVVGTINMNSLTVDITLAGDVKKGDEVVLIGKQKDKSITINSFSEQSNVLNYELLTRLPTHIPRKVN